MSHDPLEPWLEVERQMFPNGVPKPPKEKVPRRRKKCEPATQAKI